MSIPYSCDERSRHFPRVPIRDVALAVCQVDVIVHGGYGVSSMVVGVGGWCVAHTNGTTRRKGGDPECLLYARQL